MRGRHLLRSAVVIIAASLSLTACGSSAVGSSSSASSAATKAASAAPSPPSGVAPSGAPKAGSAQGAPPSGTPGNGAAGLGGAPGTALASYTPTGAVTLTSGAATKSGSITASASDQSGVLVTGGSLTLAGARVVTTGVSKSSDESSFYGLDAGVLAKGGSIALTGGSVTTSGAGANGVFAYGSRTTFTASGTTVTATGQYAHGIMASGGGTIVARQLRVSTSGGSSAPVATDRGGGTISVEGGTYRSSGANSPGIYSTGKIAATGATFVSTGSEAVVIEGSNSVVLRNDTLSSSIVGKWGVMIYQSMSGDARGAKGVYAQTGGSLTASGKGSPLFYVTNTAGVISLRNVKLSVADGVLVKAAAGQWGTSGSNGGTVVLRAVGQRLTGSLVADKLSSIALSLTRGSVLTGTIDASGAAKATSLTLDDSSGWRVTGDSHLTTLIGAGVSGSTITNITGNGHTVTYDKGLSANSYLGGRTYTLAGGGKLVAA